jgi:hypothetical protein
MVVVVGGKAKREAVSKYLHGAKLKSEGAGLASGHHRK